jgi:hypothetical protein
MIADMSKTIAEHEKHLTEGYDLALFQIKELIENSKSEYDMIGKAFLFGFGQGMKRQKALNKKRKVV